MHDPDRAQAAVRAGGEETPEGRAVAGARFTDPDNPDPAEIEALAEQYTTVAIDEANNWLAALDAGALQEAIELGYTYPLECIYPPYDCSPKLLNCPFLGENHVCYLSECGLGKCSLCPFPFPVPVRGYCMHICYRFGDNKLVGVAVFITFVGGVQVGPICVPAQDRPMADPR